MTSYLSNLYDKLERIALRNSVMKLQLEEAMSILKNVAETDDFVITDTFKANMKTVVDLKIEHQRVMLEIINLLKIIAAVETPETAANVLKTLDKFQDLLQYQQEDIIDFMKDYLI